VHAKYHEMPSFYYFRYCIISTLLLGSSLLVEFQAFSMEPVCTHIFHIIYLPKCCQNSLSMLKTFYCAAGSKSYREADDQLLLQLEEKDVISSAATILSDLCGPQEWISMNKLHEVVSKFFSWRSINRCYFFLLPPLF